MMLNYESLPKIDYNKSHQGTKDTGCEYLIITPTNPEFLQWADSIKQFRTLQGILTDVMTVADAGGNNATTLKTFFTTAYNTWDIVPTAVLLLGDYGTNAANSIISPIYNNYCASDNIFADISGNSMPDIVFARMTAQNATHLQTMVTKFLNYERTPPTSPSFYQNPITALGFQTERWFQICSESVAGFWEVVHGKTANRINAIYSGTPGATWSTATNTATVVNLFGPNGLGYIPASPNQVNCSWYGTAQNVITGINNGAFMLQHRDHGFEQGWGEPGFQSSHINSLNNTDLTFVWSVNCLTGKYNISSECFAEKFHRHTSGGNNSGAVGINAASEVSYSFVNDTYVWGAYDNMWPEFLPTYGSTPTERGILPAFANSAGKYFLQQSNWPYNTTNKMVTYNLFHHHGDAFLMIYSEVPQNLTVVHNPILFAGVTSFDVTANDGAFISLTVNGEIIGTAEATGSPVSITIPGQIPPNEVLITITKQNFYRYTGVVDVVPPSGPYVVQDSYSLNDVAGGNGNGLMDYGESVLLSLTVENVGVQTANNVVVTLITVDPYITLTGSVVSYGNIAAGATAVVTDGFGFQVANDIPNGHNVLFEVSATDGTDIWLSYLSIPGHAPVIEYIDFMILDPTGNNNGKIDPGETVQIAITIDNSGSSEAFNILGQLSVSDPFLTINTDSVNFGNLAGGNTATASFNATASPATPAGHIVTLSVNLNADLGISATGSFSLVIGQIPVLIVDLDGNTNSAIHMEASLQDVEIAYEKLTSLPADLSLYSTVFICLGVYANNHVLTSAQGQQLAAYLNSGGNLYMEGGDTWYYDPSTAVHNMFNINPVADGSSDLGTITGQAGTFSEGMSFIYNGDDNWIDRIEPISPAVKILQNQSPAYGTGVAYDAGSYRTIGTSHEFGGLTDGTSPSTKDELMQEYLGFLGISMSLQAFFGSEGTEICVGETVSFFDMSIGGPVSWSWTFEGGSPETASIQNPMVTYFNPGVFDVTLEVSDGSEISVFTIENYMTVMPMPEQASTPSGDDLICINFTLSSEYTTSGASFADSYIWEISPSEAGTISGSGTTATVEWSSLWIGIATIQVRGVNDCGEGLFSEVFDVECDICSGYSETDGFGSFQIFPNPSNGKFTLQFGRDFGMTEVQVLNILTDVVYTKSVLGEKGSSIEMDIQNTPAGIYFIKIMNERTEIIRKIMIR
jgi:PKD repeat protein